LISSCDAYAERSTVKLQAVLVAGKLNSNSVAIDLDAVAGVDVDCDDARSSARGNAKASAADDLVNGSAASTAAATDSAPGAIGENVEGVGCGAVPEAALVGRAWCVITYCYAGDGPHISGAVFSA